MLGGWQSATPPLATLSVGLLLAQFSLYVHKGGPKPDSFHFISQSAKPVQVLVHLDRGSGAELWGLVWTHVSIYAGCLYSIYGLLPGTL